MVVLTGGGTTMIELAKAIPDSLRATFFHHQSTGGH